MVKHDSNEEGIQSESHSSLFAKVVGLCAALINNHLVGICNKIAWRPFVTQESRSQTKV
jgi:hypothetical protein